MAEKDIVRGVGLVEWPSEWAAVEVKLASTRRTKRTRTIRQREATTPYVSLIVLFFSSFLCFIVL